MTIQDIAAEKAKEYAENILIDDDTVSDLFKKLMKKLITGAYMKSWQDCLNTLAGSDEEVNTIIADLRNKLTPFINLPKLMEIEPTPDDRVYEVMLVELQTCLEYLPVLKLILNDLDKTVQRVTATAVAKAVGEKDNEIKELQKELAVYKIDRAEVEEITPKIPKDSSIPYVTHEGSFEMFGEIFKVMVLNNGERVIEESDAIKLFNYLGVTPTKK